MKRELMDILACPMCKGPLQLEVTEEDENEVITGSLKLPSAILSKTKVRR